MVKMKGRLTVTKIEYFKVPLLHTRRLHKQLCDEYKALVTRKGKKLLYHGDGILVEVDRNVATVIYETSVSRKAIRKLFRS